ncbi:nuclear transport factor 2 family protein [Fulvivirga sedimenti]|uniref:Nuclear transport factor 2 family protein n=1 Tax=Fulvivirga sedimenti TaxID=2879465 RepID=A0A9X1HL83_9BACT|nr:nuclear transport factor 2 family protein [Fulvivirga sedimenti]MCA6074319.1 nuclear transport factor 2 family protein [Fulvivirga sedimenti]
MKNTILSLLLILPLLAAGQNTDDLYNTLRAQDSLLFDVGFNTCDVEIFERLVADDFEFYHDQSGITPDKASFIKGTREGLCKLDYQPIRQLDAGSLKVFPLKNNGVLYGALQTGSHRFYAKKGDEPLVLTSSALFDHLWMLEDGEWKLKRVISYAHVPAWK